MKAKKKTAVFGLSASTRTPSRNAHPAPSPVFARVEGWVATYLPSTANRSHAEPDQIQRSEPLECSEQFRARHDQGGHSKRTRHDVEQAAKSGTEARRDSLGTSSGEASSGNVEDPRPRCGGQQCRGGDKQGELGELGHG
jgi:hypothetical protein